METDNNIPFLVAKLKGIPENQLTVSIIIPLLETMGYHRVEFFGGTDEIGKDILCWDIDKFGDRNVTVAQVKHFRLSKKAAQSTSFQTVINQLIACFSNEISFNNLESYVPKEALFITTHEIDTKTILTRFGNHKSTIDRNIKIIDGPRLAELILKHTPNAAKELLGINFEISSALNNSLNNKILLTALGFNQKKELSEIYTDIDFALGKLTTELFFCAEFEPKVVSLSVSEKDWAKFKKNCLDIQEEYSLDFLNKSLETIERELIPQKAAHYTWKEKYDELNEVFQRSLEKWEKLGRELESQKKARSQVIESEKLKEKQQQFSQTGKRSQNIDYQFSDATKKRLAELKERIEQLEHEFTVEDQEFQVHRNAYLDHKENENQPNYKFELDGRFLVNLILKKRNWIEEQVVECNMNKPQTIDLRKFLLRCMTIIDTASILFSDSFFTSAISNSELKVIRNDFQSTRLKLPIDAIFNTHLNVAVVGEAGAGKTTCVQMYAQRHSEFNERLVLWLPLSRVIQSWLKRNSNFSGDAGRKELESAIVAYLNDLNIGISQNEFSYHAKNEKMVLMLDGIDEAIKHAFWLIQGIKEFAGFYENVQLIITSRTSGQYINEIPFFTVTLLEFTEQQRDTFIKKWFGDKENTIVNNIRDHLGRNKAMSEVVKTPLLATTLCVLAENDIPLPNSEIKLYDDRLRLFTGYYDNVKNVSRTTTTPQVLEAIAQKLAFQLHIKGVREERLDNLKSIAISSSLQRLSTGNAIAAVKELIDPCNILVPMTEDGKYGFGHLRYQEHLAAKEIINNRGIDLYPLLKQQWWAGVFILFAQMNDSLVWLINDIGKKHRFGNVNETIKKMISVRPRNEQHQLKELIDNYDQMGFNDVQEEQ